MAAGEVQVAPDGTGKEIDAQTVTSTLAGNPTVYRQTVTLGDPSTFGSIATVKAASTAIAATDNPLAVGLHPSSPLPAGTNALGRINTDTSQAIQNITAASSFAAIALGALNATVPAAGTFAAFSTVGMDTCGVVITGTFIGTVNFEATIDGTNWFQVQAIRVGTNQAALSNQSAEVGAWLIDCVAFSQVRARCTTGSFVSGTIAVYFYAADGPRTDLISTVPVDGQKASYSVGASITLAASATDVLTITGSASKTIRITRLILSGIATSAGTAPISLVKRTAANTGGTSAGQTAVLADTLDPAVTATVAAYSANPTSLGGGTAFWRGRLSFPVVASIVPMLTLEFGKNPGMRALVLRGTSQLVAINLNATTVTGGVLDVSIDWTEE